MKERNSIQRAAIRKKINEFNPGNLESKLNRQEPGRGQQEPKTQSAMWIDPRETLPQYYDSVIIDTGKEVLRGWARVSNGERDYYVKAGLIEDTDEPDRVIYRIKRWRPIPSETLDVYKPWCGTTENQSTGYTSTIMFDMNPED